MSLRTRRKVIGVGLPVGLALAIAATATLRGHAIEETARSMVGARVATDAISASPTEGPSTLPTPSPGLRDPSATPGRSASAKPSHPGAGEAKPDLEAITKFNAWVGAGGLKDMSAIVDDMGALTTASDKNNTPGVFRACAAMAPHVRTAQSHPPFPDQQGQDAWASLLRHLGSATVYCQKSKAKHGDLDLYNKAVDEINSTEADVQRFGDRIKLYRGTS